MKSFSPLSFLKTVSILFSSYMFVLVVLLIIYNK